MDVDVISMSVDSPFVHKMWEEAELSRMIRGDRMPFAMASDTGGSVGKLYNVYDEEKAVNMRGRFLIDPDGVVQAMEILTDPVGRNLKELFRQIAAYQHVRANKGKEVCPAGWFPGDSVLKPGPDAVGKIWQQWKPADPLSWPPER